MILTKIEYSALNSRQKENYNFHKVAGELADYGYNSLRLNDDWQGADFLAVHINGDDILRVQLKGRFYVDEKYLDKDIHIAFIDNETCYIYPHDKTLKQVLSLGKISDSSAWNDTKAYSWPTLAKWAKILLENYKI